MTVIYYILTLQICVVCTAGEHEGHDLADINMNAEPKRQNLKDWADDFRVRHLILKLKKLQEHYWK